MIKVAIYGKGGIGKSTVTSGISAALGLDGLNVMQLGCDPKTDSTINLLGGKPPTPILQYLQEQGRPDTLDAIAKKGFGNVTCMEVGGPTPGVGCFGRGMLTAFELLDEMGAYDVYKPDVVLYDILADVVCGGIAVPMREGFADKVCIVTSGEKMALLAAKNIILALRNFADRNYAELGGLILNCRDMADEVERVEEFAHKMETSVIGVIPRDTAIHQFEEEGKTIVEGDRALPTSARFFDLARTVVDFAEERNVA
ncbi:nitrogenase iron protein [Pseudodesulfovibrio nedwellii]|uniref:Nitrogenase iron protein n=1 Tax=Pseudodesulfovibrio nedwellii TaxID=2973072 RepID=A0ABN6S537_9BACT|nr:nitrogen fixation protein NifH [Pseudodesulfovibrio nedwellii]BDQ37083.1 nitrogenase iron protein [Pseudodesulfovibrio nedwellii]